jgi:hypothetical protein
MRIPFKRVSVGVAAVGVTLVLAASAAASGGFTVTPLVSSNGVPGTTPDANLVNSWGLAAGPATPWWVADNGKAVSTLYTGAGVKLGLTVAVGDNPTGVVFNSTTGFDLKGGDKGPALFLFDSEAGAVSAWNRSLGTTAEVEIDATPQGAVFKGLAIAQTSAGPRLYATDFHNRRVDVFDGNWQPVEAHGRGLGFVDSFDAATGILDGKVAVRGALNAPWGVASAPAGFDSLGGDILIGNFGDGLIHAYRPILGGILYLPAGALDTADGAPISIDGLWALEFGNGAAAGPTGTLFFTAGPNDEGDGLFGTITPG